MLLLLLKEKNNCQRNKTMPAINGLTNGVCICLLTLVFTSHQAARAAADFLTILLGYLHLNSFLCHYVNAS